MTSATMITPVQTPALNMPAMASQDEKVTSIKASNAGMIVLFI